jgi:queuosine precursor transporter
MLKTNYGRYKYLGLLAALSVTFGLITTFTAARLVTLGGVPISVSAYYFPMIFLIADVLTEVYGYAEARSVLWLCIACRLIAAAVVWLMLLIPPAPIFTHDDAYQLALSSSLRASIAALFAMSVGDICNSYVLAKMKIWCAGKHMWLRFVVSTVLSEGVNTIIAYFIIFYGILPMDALLWAIGVGTLAKSACEFIALPVTLPVVRWLKRVEGVDYYDRGTDFNPFITDASR